MNANTPAIAWTGRGNLRSLMAELERQRESRIDFCCDTSMLRLRAAEGSVRLVPAHVQAAEWLPSEGVQISDHALGQIGECAKPAVPGKYMRDLRDANPLAAAALVNATGTAQRRFVRVLDGHCRAFLSDSYRVMDHYDTTFAALDVAKNVGAKVLECSLTDSHMRIKLVNSAVFDRIADRQEQGGGAHEFVRMGQGANPRYRDAIDFTGGGFEQVAPGLVHPVVTISNSETGEGGLNVKVGIFEAYCLNTALVDTAVRQIHLGRKMEEGVRYQRDTQQADATAMGLKIRDVITQAFNQDGFAELCGRVRAANAQTIEAPSAAVGRLVDAGLIPESRKDALLEHFLGRGNKTAWGVAQGLTRLAQDSEDPAESAELELLAGKIIAQPKLVLA